jgi:hypothetical protein
MNVDGSSELITFRVDVPSGHHLGLTQMKIVLGFRVQKAGDIHMRRFGHLRPLTNGVLFNIYCSAAGLINITKRGAWKTNTDLLIPSKADTPLTVYQLNRDAVLIYHYPMLPCPTCDITEFLPGDYFQFTIQDDLSDLFCFRVTLFGILVSDAMV